MLRLAAAALAALALGQKDNNEGLDGVIKTITEMKDTTAKECKASHATMEEFKTNLEAEQTRMGEEATAAKETIVENEATVKKNTKEIAVSEAEEENLSVEIAKLKTELNDATTLYTTENAELLGLINQGEIDLKKLQGKDEEKGALHKLGCGEFKETGLVQTLSAAQFTGVVDDIKSVLNDGVILKLDEHERNEVDQFMAKPTKFMQSKMIVNEYDSSRKDVICGILTTIRNNVDGDLKDNNAAIESKKESFEALKKANIDQTDAKEDSLSTKQNKRKELTDEKEIADRELKAAKVTLAANVKLQAATKKEAHMVKKQFEVRDADCETLKSSYNKAIDILTNSKKAGFFLQISSTKDDDRWFTVFKAIDQTIKILEEKMTENINDRDDCQEQNADITATRAAETANKEQADNDIADKEAKAQAGQTELAARATDVENAEQAIKTKQEEWAAMRKENTETLQNYVKSLKGLNDAKAMLKAEFGKTAGGCDDTRPEAIESTNDGIRVGSGDGQTIAEKWSKSIGDGKCGILNTLGMLYEQINNSKKSLENEMGDNMKMANEANADQMAAIQAAEASKLATQKGLDQHDRQKGTLEKSLTAINDRIVAVGQAKDAYDNACQWVENFQQKQDALNLEIESLKSAKVMLSTPSAPAFTQMPSAAKRALVQTLKLDDDVEADYNVGDDDYSSEEGLDDDDVAETTADDDDIEIDSDADDA